MRQLNGTETVQRFLYCQGSAKVISHIVILITTNNKIANGQENGISICTAASGLNKAKSWFFEKTLKINKPLTNLNKKQRKHKVPSLQILQILRKKIRVL